MSSSNLDLSLDDLIKKSKPSNHSTKTSSHHRNPSNNHTAGAGARTGGGGGGGGKDQYHHRSLRRPAPYPNPNASSSSSSSKYGVYTDHQIAAAVSGARSGAIETGTKLYISNLDYGVTNEDIKELFSEVGDIKRYSINYDRSGRSKGTAEVVYAKKDDALAAIRRYNNVQLDGKPMKIEFIGTNLELPPIPPLPLPVLPTPSPLLPPFALNWNPPPPFLNGNAMHKSGPGRGMPAGGPRGGGFGGRGRGRGRGSGRARGKPVSADDLDAELDKYHAEAMEDN